MARAGIKHRTGISPALFPIAISAQGVRQVHTVASLLHRAPDVKEIHVVWMTTGLGCDGDSVSITAASLPSIEDLVMGAIPGLPKTATIS
jgi:hypothetical protein